MCVGTVFCCPRTACGAGRMILARRAYYTPTWLYLLIAAALTIKVVTDIARRRWSRRSLGAALLAGLAILGAAAG